ncbi:MAG: hypothetical protein V7K48_08610 [Nostoc sp.]
MVNDTSTFALTAADVDDLGYIISAVPAVDASLACRQTSVSVSE